MDNELEFFEFVYGRQLVWYNRFEKKLPRPWTTDPILMNYKFCNVYRELDRGTTYIINSVLNKDLSAEAKLFNVFTYRIFNLDQLFHGRVWPDILDPSKFNVQKEISRLYEVVGRGETLFSSAYLIRPIVFNPQDPQRQKHVQVLYLLEHLAKNIRSITKAFQSADTPYEQLRILSSFMGIGLFMAGQMLLDLGYRNGVSKWGNDDWLVVGPGATRGLKLVFPDVKSKKDVEAKVRTLRETQSKFFNILESTQNKSWEKIYYRGAHTPGEFLSIMDIQNCLCEFSKYKKYSQPDLCRRRYFRDEVS